MPVLTDRELLALTPDKIEAMDKSELAAAIMDGTKKIAARECISIIAQVARNDNSPSKGALLACISRIEAHFALEPI